MTPGPTCPYQGIHLDFVSMTSLNSIKETWGMVIPLSVADLPLSFIVDTYQLKNVDDMSKCPKNFTRI